MRLDGDSFTRPIVRLSYDLDMTRTAALVFCLAPIVCAGPSCESLSTLALPHTSIVN